VVSELLSAKLSLGDRRALQSMLVELPLCSCPFEHWVKVGELRALCSKKGFKVSTPDAHVAQCAIDLNAYLSSEDKIFTKIAGIAPLRLATR
jgi:predicted nucleic acid-binding protein